ncbi:uncharacterized protein VP01_448g2 [Puccinia sorghi]|uniref:Uncharacterized protein n=1 Tax=Puccinia sorghi TaxID=27349 RepID=A0A0L6UP70_9BASI|nr:uncharacterized protein VP01_448g2 [Puccinia sorghi]
MKNFDYSIGNTEPNLPVLQRTYGPTNFQEEALMTGRTSIFDQNVTPPPASVNAPTSEALRAQPLSIPLSFRSPFSPTTSPLTTLRFRQWNLGINRTINKIQQEELIGKAPIEVLLGFLKQSNWFWGVSVSACGELHNRFPFLIWDPLIFLKSAIMWPSLIQLKKQTVTGFPSFKQRIIYLGFQKSLQEHLACLLSPQNFYHRLKNRLTQHSNQCFSGLQGPSLSGIAQLSQKMSNPSKKVSELKQFLSKWLAIIEYLKNSILLVKEHFFVAWDRNFPHLRNLNTSHVESCNAFINIFIDNCSGNL